MPVVDPPSTNADDILVAEKTTAQPVSTATDDTASVPSGDVTSEQKTSFWQDNKKWLQPTLIVGGGIAIVAIGYTMMKQKKVSSQKNAGLSGFSFKKKKRNHHRKGKHKRKVAVALCKPIKKNSL